MSEKQKQFFYSFCEKIIYENKGKIVQFIGDAVIAVFSESQVDEALLSGITIIQKLNNLHKIAREEEKEMEENCPIPEEMLNVNVVISRADVIEGLHFFLIHSFII